MASPEVKPEQFAVLVRDVPALPVEQTRKEQIDSYFKFIYPETFYRSMVVTNNKKVNQMMFLSDNKISQVAFQKFYEKNGFTVISEDCFNFSLLLINPLIHEWYLIYSGEQNP